MTPSFLPGVAGPGQSLEAAVKQEDTILEAGGWGGWGRRSRWGGLVYVCVCGGGGSPWQLLSPAVQCSLDLLRRV